MTHSPSSAPTKLQKFLRLWISGSQNLEEKDFFTRLVFFFCYPFFVLQDSDLWLDSFYDDVFGSPVTP